MPPPPATAPEPDREAARGREGGTLARFGRAGIGRVSPHLARAGGALRRSPKVAGAFDRVAAIWWKLVDGFCEAAAPLLRRFFPDRRLVAVAAADGSLALHRVVDSAVTDLGTLAAVAPAQRKALAAARWSAVELRLPPEQVLRRSLQLPAASRAFIGPIIDHRLERLTPWRPEKVLYGYTARGDAAGGTAGSLTVALLATSRDLVAGPLGRLAEAGLVATAVGAAEERLDAPLSVNLMRSDAPSARDDARRWVSRAALAALAVLALAAGASAWVAADATGEQAAVAHKLGRARRLLRSVTTGPLNSREQAMVDAKQPGRAVVVLVDKLAAAIPADTFLKELAVTPDKVRLQGISGNAPALVAQLEAAGLLNPRFTSTITREKSGKDSFEITADRVAPKPDETQ